MSTPNSEDAEKNNLRAAADAVATEMSADVIFYNAPIGRDQQLSMAAKCRKIKRRKNVLLVLVTEGGDADAGFKIARSLQMAYERFTCLVSGYCKSAGTLVAIGAHDLIFGDEGELGPLDVQMSKKDELFETQSGLTVMTSLSALQTKAFSAFESFFLALERKSGNRITTRSATEAAAKLATGLYSPIFQQVDPLHVGEAGRASSIAHHYGERLNATSGNLSENSLIFLINGYPSHGFVIDMKEAGELFERVKIVNPLQQSLLDLLGEPAKVPLESPTIQYLSTPIEELTYANGAIKTYAQKDAKTNRPPRSTRARVSGNGLASTGLSS